MATKQDVVNWIADRSGRFAYSQQKGRLQPDSTGFTDCSGLIIAAYRAIFGIDIGTYTGTMLDKCPEQVFGTEENSADSAINKLQVGDLIFYNWTYHNPTFDHVEIYAGSGKNWSHGGPGNGPNLVDFHYEWNLAYEVVARRVSVSESGNVSNVQPTVDDAALIMPFPYSGNHYFGLISGPENSHGGYYGGEQPYIRQIQRRLISKGYVTGITDIYSSWADGIFEQPTADAVTRFQHAEMPGTQFYGQVWADDYAQLAK